MHIYTYIYIYIYVDTYVYTYRKARVMQGTRLVVSLSNLTEEEVIIRRIHKKDVVFVFPATVTPKDIVGITVIRGNEPQNVIRNHLYMGKKLLTSSKPTTGGLQFGASVLSLPTCSAEVQQQHYDKERQYANAYEEKGLTKAGRFRSTRRHAKLLQTTVSSMVQDMV